MQQALVAFESEFETRSERTFVSLQTDGLDPIGRQYVLCYLGHAWYSWMP